MLRPAGMSVLIYLCLHWQRVFSQLAETAGGRRCSDGSGLCCRGQLLGHFRGHRAPSESRVVVMWTRTGVWDMDWFWALTPKESTLGRKFLGACSPDLSNVPMEMKLWWLKENKPLDTNTRHRLLQCFSFWFYCECLQRSSCQVNKAVFLICSPFVCLCLFLESKCVKLSEAKETNENLLQENKQRPIWMLTLLNKDKIKTDYESHSF